MKEKLKRHKVKIIIVAVILVVAVIAAVALVNVFGGKNNKNMKVTRESTVTLSKMDLTTSVSATGTIESAKTKSISADTNGVKVSKVHVSVGDTVKKGDTLITFDESDLEAALEEAQENLSESQDNLTKSVSKANKQLTEAQSTYSSEKTKLAKKVSEAKSDLSDIKSQISSVNKKIKNAKNSQTKTQLQEQLTKLQEQLTQAESAYEQAVENQENTNKQNLTSVENASEAVDEATSNGNKTVKEAQKQVDQAQENLDSCVVKATMSGTVTAIGVEAGDTYSGGTIAQIDDTSSFTVTTSVDEYDISKIEKGQRVVILTEATDEDELEGEITFVSPTTGSSSSQSDGMGSSSSSSGYEVNIKISTSDERLRIGLTAKCSIILEEADDVFAVPYDAIHEDQNGNSVIYVKDGTNAREASTESESDTDNNMQQGSSSYKEIQVTKGMESDYYVEISGSDLTEGMEVIIPTDATSASTDDSSSDDFSSMFGGGMRSGDAPGGDMPGGGGAQGGMPGGGKGGN